MKKEETQTPQPLRIVKPSEPKDQSNAIVRREIDRLARQMGRMMAELQGLKEKV